ncbi:mechanosensitive ion channel [Thiomicrorhabdus sp. ZW0627]|uniref:mechanosensitive ion channel domain-containing protein n=1 Tax=Thiomicrorhabdus sp. ZW0627 TaxID=3039774 RepID=UPI002436B372|nr:mechanosensitive ion channel domain-containing protein [Thiomicrorhabdus sp. ZW0627]MDG6773815.1 mechanosensitive ion channel [Thiomicrorhabdus sp. ZW0627]
MSELENIPYIQIGISLLIPFAILATRWAVKKLILNLGHVKGVPADRAYQVYRYFRTVITVVWTVVLLVVWGVNYQALLVVASSVLAVLGVALVAQWSILSNITASIIVFFSMPARIGDEVEVIDGVNSVKGVITEINLFNVLLIDEDGNQLAYPNNLILQKPVRKTQQQEVGKPGKILEAASRSTVSQRIKNR